MYFTFSSKPGFDIQMLNHFGFEGESDLFHGNQWTGHNMTNLSWSCGNKSVRGDIFILSLFKFTHYFSRLNLSFFKLAPQLDVLSGSMLNVEEVLHRINLYYTLEDKKKERKLKLYSQDLREISVNTRPMYPASKISFNVANITKERFQFTGLKIIIKFSSFEICG